MKSLSIAVFLITAAIGWNVAGNLAPSAKSADAASAPVRNAQRPARIARKTSGPDEAARQQMAAIRASRDPAVRMRATVDLARSISPADFAAWMDGGWFDIRGGAELTLFSMILRERWELEDPDGLLAYAIQTKSGNADGILAKWAETNPQRVLDFFQSHPNDSTEIRALVRVAEKDPAMALQRLQEMAAAGIVRDQNEADYTSSLLDALAKHSPAALEAALDSLPAAMKTQAEPMLIASKMEASFDTEFDKLMDRADGMKILSGILERRNDGPTANAIVARLLEGLSSLPASWRSTLSENPYHFINQKNATQWASADLEGAGFSEMQISQLRTQALSSLYRQPETALKLLSQFEMDESNRRNVISNIFGNLKDPDQAPGLLAMLTSPEDREFAMAASAPRQQQVERSKIATPEAWLAGAAGSDPKSGGLEYMYYRATEDWDATKRADLVRQFQTLPDGYKRAIAEGIVQSGYTGNPLQADAIRFIISHPPDDPPAGNPSDPFAPRTPENRGAQLAANYVSSLAQSDPAAAGDWIGTLPTGEPKLWAQKNLHTLWSQYDPQAADQWLATQPASDRGAIKNLKK